MSSCPDMSDKERQAIKPSKNRAGDVHDRTEGDRRVNRALQLVDYDVNDWRPDKSKHHEATDQILSFIRQRARESNDPIAVSITGSASRTGSQAYNDALSTKRAACVALKLNTFLAPAILRRMTMTTVGQGFANAHCRGKECELPEFRSVLISVHAPGRKPAPVPVVPRGWNKYKLRCLSYESQGLLSGTLNDVLDRNLGNLPPVVRQRLAKWMADLIKQGVKAIPKLGAALASVLKLIPVSLTQDTALFEIAERDRPSPGTLRLRYNGRGMRLDVPDLNFVDLALPELPASIRTLIKDILRRAGVRTGLPPLTSSTPGPFKSFELTRPILMRELGGNVFMGKDVITIGKVSVVFSSPVFRTLTGQRTTIVKTSCTDCAENVVPVQIGDGRGLEVLAFSDGNFAPEEEIGMELELLPSAGWVAESGALSARHRLAYGRAQQAELLLQEEELEALTWELLHVRDEAELEQFLGKLARQVSRSATKAVKAVGKSAVAVGKAAGAVGKVVAPVVGTLAKLASHSPIGALARSTYGAVSALARGENIFMGALDGLAGSPMMRGLVKMGGAVLRGENVIAAAKQAMKAGIADVREAARFAAMVAPFVPGIGTGVGAALGAANALAAGRPISEAMISAVRGAMPGGAVAQAAFDVSANLVRGKRLDQALLDAARNQLPPGPARAAFDTGLAVVEGKKLQDAVSKGAGGLLPPSPYAGDVLSFARRAAAGENLGRAALSTAGAAVLKRAAAQGDDLIRTVQGRVQQRPMSPGSVQSRTAGAREWELAPSHT